MIARALGFVRRGGSTAMLVWFAVLTLPVPLTSTTKAATPHTASVSPLPRMNPRYRGPVAKNEARTATMIREVASPARNRQCSRRTER